MLYNARRVQAQITNDTYKYDYASARLPVHLTTAQPTPSGIQHSTYVRPITPPEAMSMPPISSGCIKNCSMKVGPMTMLSASNSWTKCVDMVKIGRIHYVVDAANNKTMTSTSFSEQISFTSKGYSVTIPATDLLANKSRIVTRTDVNSEGTVTFVNRGNTMTYPTGSNDFPDYYAWNGTLPYITDGTTSCITAAVSQTSIDTWTFTATSSLDVHTTTQYWTQTLPATTPFPIITNLPTEHVYDIDKEDPKGLTYCWDYGEGLAIGPDFVSLYRGSIFDRIYHECEVSHYAISPLVAVDVASFLLDATTSYINHPTTSPSTSPVSDEIETLRVQSAIMVDSFSTTTARMLRSSKTSQPAGSISVPVELSQTPSESSMDSFITDTKSKAAQVDHSAQELKGNPATTTGIVQVGPSDHTNDIVSSDTSRDTKAATKTESRSSLLQSFNADESRATAGKATVPSPDGSLETHAAHSPTADSGDQTDSDPSIVAQATLSSNNGGLGVLNSLIQDVGQLQSSHLGEASINSARSSMLAGSEAGAVSPTRGVADFILAGIGGTIPEESPISISNTLVESRSGQASDPAQPLNSATKTTGSITSSIANDDERILESSVVPLGQASSFSGEVSSTASDGEITLKSQLSTSSDTLQPSTSPAESLLLVTSTASDGEVFVTQILVDPLKASGRERTRMSTDSDSAQQSSDFETGSGTVSQATTDAPFSTSPSSSDSSFSSSTSGSSSASLALFSPCLLWALLCICLLLVF